MGLERERERGDGERERFTLACIIRRIRKNLLGFFVLF